MLRIAGRTVQDNYPGIEGIFSQRVRGTLQIWVWRRGPARSLIGIFIFPLIGAKILSIEGLKGEQWTPIWTLTKKRLRRQCRNLLIFFGAGNGDRTRDPRLGKPMLYQLSYARIIEQ